ncbi:FecCD family ABC transporter permease [Parvularcula bermudensis]|uniref:FecCD family ABC transporter permease n=1 Tax=Parvularcula bermudensis TaxID=208216 RepID=UPI0011D2908A|nr:iron ABC transporter permease [Parvularcula bermudensis]
MNKPKVNPTRRTARGRVVVLSCGVLALVFGVLGILLGPLKVSLPDVLAILTGSDIAGQVKTGVVLNIRLPRMVLGFAVGASLGVSGAAMQGFFRNPLADPALIGVSAGGALAAVAVIVLGGAVLSGLTEALGSFALPVAAFFGSLVIVFLIYRLAMQEGRVIVATMLLAGVAANSLAVSGIGYLTFLADDTQLRDLTFWTLGSLGGATWDRAVPAIALMAIGVAGILTLARPLNSLLFGEADAAALGTNVERTKRLAALCTALSVGAATAVCGVIGFVGLVVPHLVRLVTGPDHRFVLPGSALLGGVLVLGADLVARLAVSPAELPLGVVTSVLGAPFFFWLLLRDKKRGGFG